MILCGRAVWPVGSKRFGCVEEADEVNFRGRTNLFVFFLADSFLVEIEADKSGLPRVCIQVGWRVECFQVGWGSCVREGICLWRPGCWIVWKGVVMRWRIERLVRGWKHWVG